MNLHWLVYGCGCIGARDRAVNRFGTGRSHEGTGGKIGDREYGFLVLWGGD